MYYILAGLKQEGPFTAEQLQARGLTPDSMVWSQSFGDQEWRPARVVPQLASLFGPYSAPAMSYAPGMGHGQSIPHSRFGIASFVLGILLALTMFGLIVGCGVMVAQQAEQGVPFNEESPMAILLGLGIICGGMGHLLALVFGIAGLFQKDRRQVFSWLGIVVNAFVILGVAGLMILGTVMG